MKIDLITQLNEQKRKVDFNSYDISVKELISMVREGIIDIAPEYQRQFRWKEDRQSVLIESIFLGIPVPSLFMATNWEKRRTIFQKLEQDHIVHIVNDIMPTDGKNVRYPQLDSIWKTFCLTDPIFHDQRFRGRLEEIVLHRINIAHGNQPASDIGARVTIADLKVRLNEVSAFCTYFISVFDDYIMHKKYKR